jgi:hypothetical protein
MSFGKNKEQNVTQPSKAGSPHRRFKRANWLGGGILTLLTSAINYILYLTTGKGLTSRTGHAMEGGSAVVLSLAMLATGLVFIYLHFRRARKEAARKTTPRHH